MYAYGLSPRDIERLDPVTRLGLIENIPRIRAREMLELINAMSAVHDKLEDKKEYMAGLAETAYKSSDPKQYARLIEAITRSG